MCVKVHNNNKNTEKKCSPVSRSRSFSGVAYRICGNLHEFKVRENRISTSSVNRRGSERKA